MAADEPPVPRTLRVATWNVAAVNNNPFEYFVSHDDPGYDVLMGSVEAFVEAPGVRDITVGEIITDVMLDELCALMTGHGLSGLEKTREYWFANLKPRRIVSQFLKDPEIGAKRLCSMPDRVTNTIRSGSSTLYRPTIINCYEPEMPDVKSWWTQWKEYMFFTSATVATKSGTGDSKKICHLLDAIKKAKYPAVTTEEETISIPLQLVCMAAFDGVLVHLVNLLAPNKWHDVKTSMVAALHVNKTKRTLEILAGPVYASCDAIFIQEAAAGFVDDLVSDTVLNDRYHVLVPEQLDGKRDQNSLVLVSKNRFTVDDPEWRGEVTDDVLKLMDSQSKKGVAPGDLFAVRVLEKNTKHRDSKDSNRRGTDKGNNTSGTDKGNSSTGGRFILASFHGDTNGLASVPVIDAVDKFTKLLDVNLPTPSAENGLPRLPPTLVFGLDANTHVTHSAGKRQGVFEFVAHLQKIQLATCWGTQIDPKINTTYNARTFLQPQLNKAVRMCDMESSPLTDKHPKDHIVFGSNSFSTQIVQRDNTGDGQFIDDTPFPTMSFPSDHALVCATLEME